MQRAATSAIQGYAPKGAQGAMVSVDRDGAVLAMVGGTDYVTSNYNRATNAVRQPGSAWKLFVYLAALEAGYTPDSRVVDAPVTIDGWSPRNSGGTYAGEIDVRTAFAYSKNTVAAQLGNEVGFGAVANMARRFGITTPINTLPSMVLGTSDVRVIDMVRAFAAVQNKGASVTPYGIRKITTTDGRCSTATARRVAAACAHVCRGRHHRSAADGGQHRHGPRRADRPPGGRQDRDDQLEQGWLVPRLFQRHHHRRMDGARRCPRGAGIAGRHAPARAFAAYMKVATAKRPARSSIPNSSCRNGSSSPTTRPCSTIPTTTSTWMRTAIWSTRAGRPRQAAHRVGRGTVQQAARRVSAATRPRGRSANASRPTAMATAPMAAARRPRTTISSTARSGGAGTTPAARPHRARPTGGTRATVGGGQGNP
jgi:penicillin-binding protein 1A